MRRWCSPTWVPTWCAFSDQGYYLWPDSNADGMLRGRAVVEADLKDDDDKASVMKLVRAGGRPGGGLPARSDGTTGIWPRGGDVAESEVDLRSDDRLGPDRAEGTTCGPRHQLPRLDRFPARDRAPRRPTRPALESGWRLRRRLDVCASRRARGAHRTPDLWARAGDRCRHRRRSFGSGPDDLGVARNWDMERRARRQHARHRCAVLRHV